MKNLIRIYYAGIKHIRLICLKFLFFKKISPPLLKIYLPSITNFEQSNRHIEFSLIHSIENSICPSEYLVDIVSKASKIAIDCQLPLVEKRFHEGYKSVEISSLIETNFSPSTWPGEHYRLLAAIVRALDAKNVVEIGTFWGMGTLSLCEGGATSIITYDIKDWHSFPTTLLRDSDFEGGTIKQFIGDLQEESFFQSQKKNIENCDLIFMDAAKDSIMEKKFLSQFSRCTFKPGAILIIDDIKLWNMLQIWQDIKLPKIDISGLGHYTGTGLVELSPIKS
ncbi:hypothetical protein ICV32_01745 [Polynucleobacter sp. MWH-UH24A]|uniref:O-methyltransferase n=1 Tax=Polynucleobacter sp. MWH-UH24A TaxID=2689110 RepID=UPI001BFD562B|nr:hypothetical protein [Polynucleobacter sp. MWH-UH24A]QWD76421.1 hypothetical protein ICV32_01745 [Polynucleobacter sp. MWH-UH24A]